MYIDACVNWCGCTQLFVKFDYLFLKKKYFHSRLSHKLVGNNALVKRFYDLQWDRVEPNRETKKWTHTHTSFAIHKKIELCWRHFESCNECIWIIGTYYRILNWVSFEETLKSRLFLFSIFFYFHSECMKKRYIEPKLKAKANNNWIRNPIKNWVRTTKRELRMKCTTDRHKCHGKRAKIELVWHQSHIHSPCLLYHTCAHQHSKMNIKK